MLHLKLKSLLDNDATTYAVDTANCCIPPQKKGKVLCMEDSRLSRVTQRTSRSTPLRRSQVSGMDSTRLEGPQMDAATYKATQQRSLPEGRHWRCLA